MHLKNGKTPEHWPMGISAPSKSVHVLVGFGGVGGFWGFSSHLSYLPSLSVSLHMQICPFSFHAKQSVPSEHFSHFSGAVEVVVEPLVVVVVLELVVVDG